MLKMMFDCTDCGHEGDVADITNLDGQCPYCGNHHGNVIYGSKMDKNDFVEELSKMSEANIAKYAQAIQLMAEDIVDNGL